MGFEDGKSWIERKPNIPFVVNADDGLGRRLRVVTTALATVLNATMPDDWKEQYEKHAKKEALNVLLAEEGLVPKPGLIEADLEKLISNNIELAAGPFVSPRPSEPIKYLFQWIKPYISEAEEPLSFALGTETLAESTIPDTDFLLDTNDYVEFASFVEFSRRMEILALKYDEYEKDTKSDGLIYFGPEEEYDDYIFGSEARALRSAYEQIWEHLKKNGVSSTEQFGILFSTPSDWNATFENLDTIDIAILQSQWLEDASIVGIYRGYQKFGAKGTTPASFLTKGSMNDFSSSPFNDSRRLWLIRRIKESTDNISPFADMSLNVSGLMPEVEITGLSAEDIKFGCKMPSFSKSGFTFTHDDFVKKYVRPKPTPIPRGSSRGAGSKEKSVLAALINWEQIKEDFSPTVTESQQGAKESLVDRSIREAVQNRRKNISNYVGDFVMAQLPERPKKIRTLPDVYKYFLNSLDIPALIVEALECMYLDISIDDILQYLCDQMLEEVFRIDLEKLDKFATFLDSGEYIPGTVGNALEAADISVTDMAYIIRNAIEEAMVDATAEGLSGTTLDAGAQQALIGALDDKFQGGRWQDVLCGAIIAAAFLLGKGIMMIVDSYNTVKKSNVEDEATPDNPIPPFKKCNINWRSLHELPIAGTLYDMAMRKAEEEMDKKIIEFVEQTLVLPVHHFISLWRQYCIEDEKNHDHNYGGITLDDMPKSPNDDIQLRKKFFGDQFDFETFLKNLFAALTPRELCSLMNGETPSDRVARFVVAYVQNYPLAPTKLKNKVSEESKVVSFFAGLQAHFDTSICDDLPDYPENPLHDPCQDTSGLNYSEQAAKSALESKGLSQADAQEQVALKKNMVMGDMGAAIAKLNENTDLLTSQFEETIKQTAQDAWIDQLAGSEADAAGFETTGFAILLDTIINSVVVSFKNDAAKFYIIMASNEALFQQIYDKIIDLIGQRIFGDDIPEHWTNLPPLYPLVMIPEISKYHNYTLEIDTDTHEISTLEVGEIDEACKQIIRQKALMKRIMDNAEWKQVPTVGNKGETARMIQITKGDPYRGFPMEQKDQALKSLPGPPTPGHSWTRGDKLEGGYWPDHYDPANIANPHSANYWEKFTKEELDDLFRIAFRYYTRYTYNYKFNPYDLNNYWEKIYGRPKAESVVLKAKSGPDDLQTFYGYSSFLDDPVLMDNEDIIKHLDGVDFRMGHRGPGGTPYVPTSPPAMGTIPTPKAHERDLHTWASFLKYMAAYGNDAQGKPNDSFGGVSITGFDARPTVPWGFYDPDADGWNIYSTKECLLRLFLFRFDGPVNFTEANNYNKYLSILSPAAAGAEFLAKSSGTLFIFPVGANLNNWKQQLEVDWTFIESPKRGIDAEVGGHLERARTYYDIGLDFHPGHWFFPFGGTEFTFSQQVDDDDYSGPLHTVTLDEFKFSELAEYILKQQADMPDPLGTQPPDKSAQYAIFELAIGGSAESGTTSAGDESEGIIKVIEEAQPEASPYVEVETELEPWYGDEVHTEGPFEGQKIPLWRLSINRPTLSIIFGCTLAEDVLAGNILNYEGVLNFQLMPQLPRELDPDESKNSYCIIDRYQITSKIGNVEIKYQEYEKLIGIETVNWANDQKGRFREVTDILKNYDILGASPDNLIPGPSLAQVIDPEVPVQPQVFEKYLTQKITEGPLALRPHGINAEDSWGSLPHIEGGVKMEWIGDKLLNTLVLDKTASFELYGVLFRHVIKQISFLTNIEKENLKQFLEKQDFSQLELDLSTIKTKALADFKALVQKSNPFTGEDVPTLEDVLLNIDDDGLGGAAAKILAKIIIIEHFLRSIAMTIIFSIDNVMQDNMVINYFAQSIVDSIKELYKKNNIEISTTQVVNFVTTLAKEEMGTVVELFKKFYNKEGEYEDVIDQVILRNEKVYDLAKMHPYLLVSSPVTGLAWNVDNQNEEPRLSLPGEVVYGDATIFQRNNLTWVLPRFAYEEIGLNEGFILEKYIKLKFHTIETIRQNLLAAGMEEATASEVVSEISQLPIEHKGEVYSDDTAAQSGNAEGNKPVYLNVEEFQEVFSKFINLADLKAEANPGGSIFDWKQLPSKNDAMFDINGIYIGGWKTEFDEMIEDALKDGNWEQYGYESAVAVGIQKELAFLEQICTLVPYETPVDVHFANGQGSNGLVPFCEDAGRLGVLDPYFIDPDGAMTCGGWQSVAGPNLVYSDLSTRHLEPKFFPDMIFMAPPQYWTRLNVVPTDDPRYVAWTELPNTRPIAPYYLEHLNGQKIYKHPDLVKNIEHQRTMYDLYQEWDQPSPEEFWTYVALAPLQVENIWESVIPNADHRKMLTNIAFRYYTMKYFGDYTGFKFEDPHANWEICKNILHGDYPYPDAGQLGGIILEEMTYDGVGPVEIGEFYGERKGIADMMFPDDEVRREWYKSHKAWTFDGWKDDPTLKWAFVELLPNGNIKKHEYKRRYMSFIKGGDIHFEWTWTDDPNFPGETGSPMYYPPGVDNDGAPIPEHVPYDILDDHKHTNTSWSQEKFERLMLFGLFFGFDCGAKWKIIQQQHEEYHGAGDWEQLTTPPFDFAGSDVVDFTGEVLGPDFPPGAKYKSDFKYWTSSYQRDLFKAMQLYKNGHSGLGLPSPIEIFTNDVLISDTLEFNQKTSIGAVEQQISTYAEEAAYGVRLSCLLPQQNHDSTQEFWKNPLSITKDNAGGQAFYEATGWWINGNDPEQEDSLLAIKRLKAYSLREYPIDLADNPAAGSGALPGKLTFLFPLLDMEHDVTHSKKFLDLLVKNWHEEYDFGDAEVQNNLALYKKMKNKEEFRLLFEYVFPIKRILSLVAIHNIKSFGGIMQKGGEDIEGIFETTKKLLQDLSLTEKS